MAIDDDAVRARWDAYWARGGEDTRDASWLEPWMHALEGAAGPVLEIGCGAGLDAQALVERGIDLIALDYSAAALERVGRRAPQVRVVLGDLREGLPFADASLGAVVASLSLHYFDAATTDAIVRELARCLRRGGLLLARVNSTRDLHYGAEGNPQLEPGLHEVRGRPKRFFARADVQRFFGRSPFTLEHVEEVTIGIVPEKHAWLVAARR
jgi:SAM-dependent methyltransferase